MSLERFNAGEDGLDEYREKAEEEQLCEQPHPLWHQTVRCTLPAGHGPVTVPGSPFFFDHFDGNKDRAWVATRR